MNVFYKTKTMKYARFEPADYVIDPPNSRVLITCSKLLPLLKLPFDKFSNERGMCIR